MNVGLWLQGQKERHRWRTILNVIFRGYDAVDGVGWIDMTQNRDEWKAFVNGVMHLWVA
jgi:hypothetical protein